MHEGVIYVGTIFGVIVACGVVAGVVAYYYGGDYGGDDGRTGARGAQGATRIAGDFEADVMGGVSYAGDPTSVTPEKAPPGAGARITPPAGPVDY
jgi:hypothetical protein